MLSLGVAIWLPTMTNIGRMRGGKMAPDYDLSNLPASQADLWICLQVDAIFGQIMADQAERLGFPLVQGAALFPP